MLYISVFLIPFVYCDPCKTTGSFLHWTPVSAYDCLSFFHLHLLLAPFWYVLCTRMAVGGPPEEGPPWENWRKGNWLVGWLVGRSLTAVRSPLSLSSLSIPRLRGNVADNGFGFGRWCETRCHKKRQADDDDRRRRSD